MRKIKKLLKRVLVFILVLSISFCSISKKEEKTVQAVVGIDDAAIIGLIVTGTALVLGTYNYVTDKNDKGVVDSFKEAFGTDTYKHLYNYITGVGMADAAFSLSELTTDNPKLAAVAKKVKSQYKYPVEQVSDNCYRTYDTDGSVIEFNNLLMAGQHIASSGRLYYMVDSLDNCPFTVDTSGKAILKEGVYNDLKSAVSTLTKTVVNVGKNVLDWAVDKYKAVNSVKSVTSEYFNYFGEGAFSDFYDKTCFVMHTDYSPGNAAISFNGVIVEFHYQGSTYIGNFSVDRFKQLNDLYSSTGEINVYLGNLSKYYLVMYDWMSGIYNGSYSNSTVRHPSCEFSVNSDGSVSISWSAGDSGAARLISSDDVHLVNNGLTGNYLIGNVDSNGTVSWGMIGESNDSNYVDGLTSGDVSVKVNGDVEVSDKILQTVIDNAGTVEDINSSLSDVNDSVKVIDDTVNNGFSSANGFLSNIANGISDIGSNIASFFTLLFRWLSDILNAIKAVPIDIVGGLSSVGNAIRDLPSDFVGTLADIKDGVLSIPAFIEAGVDVVIPDAVTNVFTDIKEGVLAISGSVADSIADIGDFVIDLPGDISDTVKGIFDAILSIPGKIINLLKDLFIYLFVPNDNFFHNQGNDFKNKLQDILPYDTYVNILDDLKTIANYKLEDFTITIMGQKCTILSFSWYYKYEEDIAHLIRGFMFFALIFFNINQLYKLIRGFDLKSGGFVSDAPISNPHEYDDMNRNANF